MRGATCAIFMMTFTPPRRLSTRASQQSSALWGRIGFMETIFIEAIKKSLRLRGELESNGDIGGIWIGQDAG